MPTRAELTDKLEAMARARGTGFLVLILDEKAHACPLPGSRRVVFLDLKADDFLDQFDPQRVPEAFAPESQLLPVAAQFVQTGLAYRHANNPWWAYCCYRFSLVVALHFRIPEGVNAIVGNLWTLREMVREIIRHLSPHGNDADAVENCHQMQQVFGREGRIFADRVRELGDELARSGRENDALEVRLSSQRLRHLTGEAGRRASFYALRAAAEAAGRRDLVHLAVIEELVQTELGEIMLPLSDSPAKEKSDFPAVWETYLRDRRDLPFSSRPHELLVPAFSVVAAFEEMRSRAVAGGGSFGHRVSYLVSGLLQHVARDLCGIQLALGDHDGACLTAERMKTCAVSDWMARSHSSMRLLIRPSISGSVGEVSPASLAEIEAAAARESAPLLMYVSTGRGYAVWMQKPGGERLFLELADPSDLIGELRGLLPSLRARGEGDADGGAQRNFVLANAAEPSEDKLLRLLRDLREILIPPRLQEAMRGQGRRLIIVGDPLLEDVPFCALLGKDGSFLVEEHEILYWPSVKALLLLQESQLLGAGEKDPCVVLGDPSCRQVRFTPSVGRATVVNLSALRGARQEAREVAACLGVEAFVGEEATLARLPERRPGRTSRCPVLHIAAHGLLDLANSERSSVVLSDGLLTVRDLLEGAHGAPIGLVMLSACQTFLGRPHLDGTLSLATAFLIAGAHTVGATLWNVSDDSTQLLMREFYGHVQRRCDLAEALSLAQVSLLRTRRNPYHWAAFKLYGTALNLL